ncbi:MAG: TolC family protein [Nitrospinota bacterium]|nr:TolC family protein [Nitrospinota bacterium]
MAKKYIFFLLCVICVLCETADIAYSQKPAGENGSDIVIGEKEALLIALKNNFDILITRSVPQIGERNLGLAESEFDLSLYGSVNRTNSITPSTSVFANPEVGEQFKETYSVGVRQKLKPGTRVELAYEKSTTETNSTFSGVNPQFDNYLKLSINQPLMKGMGLDVNNTNVYIAKNSMKIDENEYRMRVMDVLSKVRDTYWDTVYLSKELEVQKESLALAIDFRERIKLQVKVGALAPIDIVAAEASVALREEALIDIDEMIQNNQDALKAMLNMREARPGSPVRIVPKDEPLFKAVKADVESLKKTAYENRPDFKKAQLLVDMRRRELKYNKNQLLPTVDLQGSVRLKGVRGEGQEVVGLDGKPVVSNFAGTQSDSLEDMKKGDYYDYSVGVVAEMPLFNRPGRHRAAKSRLETEMAENSLLNARQAIDVGIHKVVREVETAEKRISASKLSLKLAEKKLEAEVKKYEVGSSTSFAVLEYQKDLAAEKTKAIKAVIDHIKALSHMELATGTLLDKNNISLEFNGE